MKILLIDDDPSVTMVLKEFLGFKHEVLETNSGNRAIEILNNHQSSFDLVICDYQMPDGDGLSVLRYLKSSDSTIKFMMFTSCIDLNLPLSYESFLGIYKKPDFTDLLRKVSEVSVPPPD